MYAFFGSIVGRKHGPVPFRDAKGDSPGVLKTSRPVDPVYVLVVMRFSAIFRVDLAKAGTEPANDFAPRQPDPRIAPRV